jgi:hypothetical protein
VNRATHHDAPPVEAAAALPAAMPAGPCTGALAASPEAVAATSPTAPSTTPPGAVSGVPCTVPPAALPASASTMPPKAQTGRPRYPRHRGEDPRRHEAAPSDGGGGAA